MKLLFAIVSALSLLLLSAFCLFGFLATFEPTNNALIFRVGYMVIGLSSLVGVGFLMVNAFRK